MHRRPFFLLTFLLILTISAFTIPSGFVSHAASQQQGYSLGNVVTFNSYGQFAVNDTIHETTNSTAGISSFTLGFPSSFVGHVTAISSKVESGSSQISASASTSVSSGNFMITISLSQALKSGTNSNVSLGFYVLKTLKPNSTTNYLAPILFSPSVSIPVDKVVSTLTLPYNISDSTTMKSIGYSLASTTFTGVGSTQTWNGTQTNETNTIRSASVLISSPTSSAMEFTYAHRQLNVDSGGSITVEDTLKVHNYGLNTVTSLAFSPLTNSTVLTVVPASDPPLSNVRSITLSSGTLDLTSINEEIEPNSSVTLIFQYQLGTMYWQFSKGYYQIDIPTVAPVSGLVDFYQITSSLVSGVVTKGAPISLSGYNTTTIGSNVNLSYRIGVASSYAEALPLAGLLFLGVFVAGLAFRPKSKETEDVSSSFDALIKTLEDKVSGTNEILSELKSRGSSATRNDLALARSRVDDLRVKTNSRVGSLRAQLVLPNPTIQAGLNEIVGQDREFDRIIRDILNNYDQFISKRLKEEAFVRAQQNNEHRLQNRTNNMLDKAHDLREEYESEG